jgi:hypothetical protein
MAEFVTDQFTYMDGGRKVRKSTWYDPATGQTWDTFDDAGEGDSSLATGTVVDQGSPYTAANAVDSGAAYAGMQAQGAAADNPNANVPLAGNTPTYAGDNGTKAVRTPQSNVTTTTPQGGAQVPPTTAYINPQGAGQSSADPNLQQSARNSFLYPDNDPRQALQNVLRNMGLYSSLGNPFSNILMRAAPGLGSAFAIGNVNRNPGDVSSDVGGDFAKFLQQNIAGSGGQSLFGTLNNARQGLGSAIDTISQTAGNADPSAVSPYITALRSMLEQQGGMGLAGIMQGLSAPFMSPGMSQTYGQGLQSAIGQGVYNYGNSPTFTADQNAPENYWMRYLFGGGRP